MFLLVVSRCVERICFEKVCEIGEVVEGERAVELEFAITLC